MIFILDRYGNIVLLKLILKKSLLLVLITLKVCMNNYINLLIFFMDFVLLFILHLKDEFRNFSP